MNSNEPTGLTPMTNQKSVIVTELLQKCKGICFISREEKGSGFQFDCRNYYLEKNKAQPPGYESRVATFRFIQNK